MKKAPVYLLVTAFAVLEGLSFNARAADYHVIADSPVNKIVYGKDVTFDWHLRHTSNPQTKFVLETSAGNKTIESTVTEHTWTDFPPGYGWWRVIVYKDLGSGFRWYGQTSPKKFHLQFPPDWTGYEYSPVFAEDGRVVFFEVQRDYTINLPSYFLDPEKLPDCCESTYDIYHWWASSLPKRDWDFIHLAPGGLLTIRKGYRWDGASYPCKNYDDPCIDDTFNIRSSMVHDTFYDLMRMNYLDPDYSFVPNDPGAFNRSLADKMLYMIGIEDGQHKERDKLDIWPLIRRGAEPDYDLMRVWGARATRDTGRLGKWKYHVSGLTATPSAGQIELNWKSADYLRGDPLRDTHFAINDGYVVFRAGDDGWKFFGVDSSATSFSDGTVTGGSTYLYQIWPKSTNTNLYDWSNIVVVTAGHTHPVVDAGSGASINEGDSFIGSGSFTASTNGTWTATVNYGDGSGVQVLPLTENDFTLNHAYGDNGVYTVTITVRNEGGESGTGTAQIRVANVAPTTIIDSMTQPNSHFILPVVHKLTLNGSFSDPGWLDIHTSSWDLGDGTVTSGTLTEENAPPSSSGQSTARHAYAAPGTYLITLSVTDSDGGTDTVSKDITVSSYLEALTLLNDYIQGLPDRAFKNHSDHRKNAMSNKLGNVIALFASGAHRDAMYKLRRDVRAKADGTVDGRPNNDWIIHPRAQRRVCAMIDDIVTYVKEAH